MAKRKYINLEHDAKKRKTCNRNKKGAKEKEDSPVQRITTEKEELLKHPLYEDYTFQKLDLSLTIMSFILLKQHNYLLIASQDEIMLTNPTTFECITKIKFPTENIYHIIELSNGKIITACDKRLYMLKLNKNNELEVECCMTMYGRHQSFGLLETKEKNIADFRDNYLILYEPTKLEIIKNVEDFDSGCLFLPKSNIGVTFRFNKLDLVDLKNLKVKTSIQTEKRSNWKGIILDIETEDRIVVYSSTAFYVCSTKDKKILKDFKRVNGINCIKRLKYKDYVGTSEKDGSVTIFDLKEGVYNKVNTFALSNINTFFLHEVTEYRIIYNIDKERFAFVDYVKGTIIYYKNVPYSKDYRRSILLPDKRLVAACSKRLLVIK